MTEIVRIELENEMDLILIHKRSMKLAELCGLSVLKQTAFATAVSEIARCVIGKDQPKSTFILGISAQRGNRKEISATLKTTLAFGREHDNSVKYAKRLVEDLVVSPQQKGTDIHISEKINFSGLLNEARIEAFIAYFKKEPPLSPYDEIRKKNIQLLEVAEKLKESEDQYRRLTDSLPLMIFTVNPSGHLTYGNQWLKEYFSLLEVQPGQIHWHGMLHPNDHKHVMTAWEKSQNYGIPLSVQARLKKKISGEALWHMLHLIPIVNEEKQVTGWTGYFADIHAQKLVEETLKNNVELKHAQKQLLNSQAKLENSVKELNKSNHDLEQFAYIASHDLQEPLRKIRNFVDLLKSNLDNPERLRKYSEKIEVASTRMSALIKDVLNYSRLSRGESSFEETDLKKVLEHVKSDIELLVDEKQARIMASDLPVITGLPLQLYQLFYNLISNSIKFSVQQPLIEITASQLSHAEIQQYPDLHTSVNYVRIRFRDNGIGFEQKHAREIFTIFKRLNPKEEFEGTGIGLSLCKKIVDNHHGLIWAESEPGKGTTFSVVLPMS